MMNGDAIADTIGDAIGDTSADTIFALATPAGGAIAILRASGPACLTALQAITHKDFSQKPRQLLPAALFHAEPMHGAPYGVPHGVPYGKIDEAMAVYFRAPTSYTGEDMLELHCHGGPAVVRAAQAALAACGLRPAEPGEFTRRAFLNGKLDLTQAEAVMDLIGAEAALSARAALAQLQGRLKTEISQAESLLVTALASINAAIDYPEELEEDVFTGLPQQLFEVERLLAALIAQGRQGRILRDGFRVVLLGAPNAGKSSLLNALLGQDRAIVTAQPGTTRDTLTEMIVLGGIPVLLTDTAGLRPSQDEAERQGVLRTKAAAEQADAALLLLDGSLPLPADTEALLKQTASCPRILLRTKADLPAVWEWDALPLQQGERMLCISALTSEGLPALCEAIQSLPGTAGTAGTASAASATSAEINLGDAYVTNQRHIQALQAAHAAVQAAMRATRENIHEDMDAGADTGIDACMDADSIATDLRDALLALGSITGHAVDDAVIDTIFQRFCVGK